MRRLNTNTETGLDAAEIPQRLAKYGPNRLPEAARRGPCLRFLLHVVSLPVVEIVAVFMDAVRRTVRLRRPVEDPSDLGHGRGSTGRTEGMLKCGVAMVDLRTGKAMALLEFQTAVEEIFDVQVLAGLRFPELLGFQKEAIQHTFVVHRA
jgi:hypothetical protein